MTNVSEKLEAMKKWARSITMPMVVTVASMTTGCASMGIGERPAYDKYFDPNTANIQDLQKAYSKKGQVLEPTIEKDANGQDVLVYGLRNKTAFEKTTETCVELAPIVDTVGTVGGLALGTVNTVYTVKGTHALQKSAKATSRQTEAMRELINQLNRTKCNSGSSCGK